MERESSRMVERGGGVRKRGTCVMSGSVRRGQGEDHKKREGWASR